MVTATSIDTLVKTVTSWSQTLRQSANAVTERAHDQYMGGTIELATYSGIAQQSIAALQQCIAINDGAANMVAQLGLADLDPIVQGTKALSAASAKIDQVQKVATIAAELFAAVAAVATAVASPTFAAVAAAGAALSSVAGDIGK